MKKIISLILVFLMIAIPLASCDTDTQKDTETNTDAPITGAIETEAPTPIGGESLYVGYGRECITPYNSDGSIMNSAKLAGYAELRPIKAVKDDVYASCTAVKDKNGNIALIYSLDLHGTSTDVAKKLITSISKDLSVPEENIILNMTHCHSAANFADEYKDFTSEKIIEAGRAAIEDLSLVTSLYTADIKIENMNFIRRYIYDDKGNPIAHVSENDPYMPTVKFVREGKKDVYLVNWAAHPAGVNATDPNALSADYIATFRENFEKETGAYVSLHMAAAADVGVVGLLKGEPSTSNPPRYGKQLSNALVSRLSELEAREIKSEIKSQFEKVRIAFDHSDDAKGAIALEIMTYYWDVAKSKVTDEVQKMIDENGFLTIYDVMSTKDRYVAGVYDRLTVGAVSIGNVVFGVAPYEMCAVNGKRIKDSADEFDLAFMCAYTNGRNGYIASEELFEIDGGKKEIYEVYVTPYEPNTATILQDSIIASIDELGK